MSPMSTSSLHRRYIHDYILFSHWPSTFISFAFVRFTYSIFYKYEINSNSHKAIHIQAQSKEPDKHMRASISEPNEIKN